MFVKPLPSNDGVIHKHTHGKVILRLLFISKERK
jgi:hypothetical protein